VAAVVAVALTEPGHESQEYEVTGPEPLSYADVAAELSEVQGRTITYVDVDDDATRKVLLGYGVGEWLAGALVDLSRTIADLDGTGTPARSPTRSTA